MPIVGILYMCMRICICRCGWMDGMDRIVVADDVTVRLHLLRCERSVELEGGSVNDERRWVLDRSARSSVRNRCRMRARKWQTV